jgi:acetoacetate decarboxylase
MSFQFIPGRMYRMPAVFGPSLGPRQGEDGRKFTCAGSHKTITRSVSFLTNHDQLEELLPEGFAVRGEPVATVFASYMKEIEWLAGRGYNVLGVTIPVTFTGKVDRANGNFLTVLWENLTDPIVTGREELGVAKIYCELPEPRIHQGVTHCMASWLGFKFLDMTISDLKPAPPAPAVSSDAPPDDGLLHYKYIPRTEAWGEADAAYATLTPAASLQPVEQVLWRGQGTVQFHRATWEDLPTQYTIVNAFHQLEIKEYRGATVAQSVGATDLSAQRILR